MRIKLNNREVNILLAALENWQIDSLNENLIGAYSYLFEEPLSEEEVEALRTYLTDQLTEEEIHEDET